MNINGTEICLPESVRKRVRQSMDFSHSLSEEKWLTAQVLGYSAFVILLSRRKHGRIRTVLTGLAVAHLVANLVTAPEQVEISKKRIAEMRNKQAFDDIIGQN